MAEAIELNFPSGKKNPDDISNIVEETVRELTKEVNEKDETDTLQRYHIENYYEGDTLGADVLKNKYLAPWESHPYELWQRQAKALASVEKTKKLKNTPNSFWVNYSEDKYNRMADDVQDAINIWMR